MRSRHVFVILTCWPLGTVVPALPEGFLLIRDKFLRERRSGDHERQDEGECCLHVVFP